MSYRRKKHAWLFEQKNGKFSLLRQVSNPRLIEDIKSIEDAEVIAQLIGYKIVKVVPYTEDD